MTKCMYGQCGRPARWQIVIKLWALLMPRSVRNEKKCVRMLSGVTVCDDCRPNVNAQNFLLPEGRARIAQGLARAGAAVPDFATAAVDFEPIIDKPVDPEQLIRDVCRRGGSVIEA